MSYDVVYQDKSGMEQSVQDVPEFMATFIQAWCKENDREVISYTQH